MITKKSFKLYSKLKNFIYIIPRFRIFNFKRPKWKLVKKSLSRFFINFPENQQPSSTPLNSLNTRVYNISDTIIPVKKFNYKFLKKERIDLKTSLFAFFGNQVSSVFYKKILKKSVNDKINLVLQLLIKPLYKIEILLWKLGFYSTIFQLRQQIALQNIYLNNKIVQKNQFVKAGDIIFIKNKTSKSLSYVPTFLCSFVEVDYYSQTIIIINNWETFNNNSLFFLYHEMFNLDSFVDYITVN